MTIAPELLAAYADGELDGQEASTVAAAIAANPELQAQLAAHRALRRHSWPGNARELRSVIEQARLLVAGAKLDAGDLEPHLPEGDTELDLRRRTRALERQLFAEALRRAGGRKADAAKLLGIDPSNWAYHAKRLGL